MPISSSSGRRRKVTDSIHYEQPGNIYQSIEILSKEKGIEPKIILDAVKDAMLVAARKHFHTNEELVADLDERTGAIQIYGVKTRRRPGDRPGERNQPG